MVCSFYSDPKNHCSDIISAQIPYHHGDTVGCGGCHEQVYMISHQYIGMQCAVMCQAGSMQQVQVKSVVTAGIEIYLPVIAALGYMLGNIGQIQASRARHGDSSVWIATSLSPIHRDRDKPAPSFPVRKCIRPL